MELTSTSKLPAALQNLDGFNSAVTEQNKVFFDFLMCFRKAASITTDSYPLSTLSLGASFHFHSKRSKTPSPGSTIRQMLYWLSGVAITPPLVDLLQQFKTVVSSDITVAVSGLTGAQQLRQQLHVVPPQRVDGFLRAIAAEGAAQEIAEAEGAERWEPREPNALQRVLH
ncbi:hybrid sensor histidine kinase/response regulator [Babesia caballi]|uniref:Hybrid sensor histidine kinase/response regulator n=1 Tax=Babesia caballi TaxID=5871 RepID=A0AAV4LLR8_BABCB|nr:hybrid sensor histidine kinase/response regulator [Babesia caballi]